MKRWLLRRHDAVELLVIVAWLALVFALLAYAAKSGLV
jgi:hypothetical protein